MQPSPEELTRIKNERIKKDSIEVLAKQNQQTIPTIKPAAPKPELATSAEIGSFALNSATDTVVTRISTDVYDLIFSNLGAGPIEVFLKEYKKWDGTPVQMLQDTLRSAYSMSFISTENYLVETRNVLFIPINASSTKISGNETTTLQYALPVKDGRLVYTYHFSGNSYQIGVDIQFENISQYISSRKIDFGFKSGLNTTEKSRSIEAKESSADFFAGDEHETLLLTKAEKLDLAASGKIEWVATKSKFFAQVIKPHNETEKAYLVGEVTGDISTENAKSHYLSELTVIIPEENGISFDIYMGPLRLALLNEFSPSADELVKVGYHWMRFFSVPLVKWGIIPFFEFTSKFVSNYGIIIILFGIVIKLILYPFTKKSFESAAAMRQLTPEMTAIREKYSDNPQKQQEAILKLYKTAGVNPLGGCLPNLLQMPILVTLWMYFQSSIMIRQKSFLWASDLSAPDAILNLPFHIPFIGDHIGGFVLLMAVSMVIQMQTSGQTQSNPQMKFLPYMMPIVMFVFFNNIASGLSLYYFVYNAVSIAQQMLINKQIDHTKLMSSIEGNGKSASKSSKGSKKK